MRRIFIYKNPSMKLENKEYLPTEKQLVQEIKRERELVETEQRLKK